MTPEKILLADDKHCPRTLSQRGIVEEFQYPPEFYNFLKTIET
jgi:hypothetical protein